VFYAHKGGGSYVKTQLSLYLFLLGRRHVSATVGHPQVTEMYNEEKLYIVRSLVAVHIVNFQRDLVVVRFNRIELIICSTRKVGRVKAHIHVVRDVL
jgi:dipeptide/tripeptide permease